MTAAESKATRVVYLDIDRTDTLTAPHVAAVSGKSKVQVGRWAAAGELVPVNSAYRRLFALADVEKFCGVTVVFRGERPPPPPWPIRRNRRPAAADADVPDQLAAAS